MASGERSEATHQRSRSSSSRSQQLSFSCAVVFAAVAYRRQRLEAIPPTTAKSTAHGTFKQPSKRSAVRVARQQQQDPPQQEPAAAGSSSFLFLVLLFLRLSPIGGSGEGSPPPHGQLFLFPFPPFYL